MENQGTREAQSRGQILFGHIARTLEQKLAQGVLSKEDLARICTDMGCLELKEDTLQGMVQEVVGQIRQGISGQNATIAAVINETARAEQIGRFALQIGQAKAAESQAERIYNLFLRTFDQKSNALSKMHLAALAAELGWQKGSVEIIFDERCRAGVITEGLKARAENIRAEIIGNEALLRRLAGILLMKDGDPRLMQGIEARIGRFSMPARLVPATAAAAPSAASAVAVAPAPAARPAAAIPYWQAPAILEIQDDKVQAALQKLREDPNNAKNHYDLGCALEDLKQYAKEALVAFKRVTELNPNDAPAHSLSGWLLNKFQQYEEAIIFCRRAIELYPDDETDAYFAHFNLGVALNNLGKHQEAVVALRRAIQLNPNYEFSHFHLGGALRELGRHEEALQVFETALNLPSCTPGLRRQIQAEMERIHEARFDTGEPLLPQADDDAQDAPAAGRFGRILAGIRGRLGI